MSEHPSLFLDAARLPYPTYRLADYQMPLASFLAQKCPECSGSPLSVSGSLYVCHACRLQIPNFPVADLA